MKKTIPRSLFSSSIIIKLAENINGRFFSLTVKVLISVGLKATCNFLLIK